MKGDEDKSVIHANLVNKKSIKSDTFAIGDGIQRRDDKT